MKNIIAIYLTNVTTISVNIALDPIHSIIMIEFNTADK
jgi:hypothetical protein